MAALRVALALALMAAVAQAAYPSVYNGKRASFPVPRTHPRLKFNSEGKFKIMQVADVHYANGPATGCSDIWKLSEAGSPGYVQQEPCTDVNSTMWLAAAVAREKPDLVIFTGDNLVHDGVVDQEISIQNLTKPLRDANIPWMMTWGNHDCERADCRFNLTRWDKTGNKLSLTTYGPKGMHGVGNYAYSIRGRDGKPAHALYIFDQGAYQDYPTILDGGYDFIHPEQVEWYNKTSVALQRSAGKKVPASAWFHIPLPEYDTAYQCSFDKGNTTDGSENDFGAGYTMGGMGKKLINGKNKPGCNGTLTGVFQEGVYSAYVNSGLFSAFTFRGDVRMVNVGHDHVNDFCADLLFTRLCYGGGFGYHAYGKKGWPRRTRLVELSEDGSITTWKLLDAFGGYETIDRETF